MIASDRPRLLQARGRSVATIAWDPAEWALRRPEERKRMIEYHVDRLLAGETTAESEWRHLGLFIELEEDTDGGPEG
jgi:hypothetical protein